MEHPESARRICSQCGEDKPLEEYYFDGFFGRYRSDCKACALQRQKSYNLANSQQRFLTQKKYRKRNQERLRAYNKQWAATNSLHAEQRRQCAFNRSLQNCIRLSVDLWKTERRMLKPAPLTPAEKRARKRQYEREYANKNPAIKIKWRLRRKLYKQLKGIRKPDHTMAIVGCHHDHLKRHIEQQFKGHMSWDNYGKTWHLDHFVPCSYFDFNNPDEVRRCFHFTNLRPLWGRKNMRRQDDVGDLTPFIPLPAA